VDVDVFLCDSARVRENLLHVLGGGITRLRKEAYPAPMQVDLALMVTLTPSERANLHSLGVDIRGADGEIIFGLQGQFGISELGPDTPAWENSQVPIAIQMQLVAIPEPGDYVIEVMIDNRSTRSLHFRAEETPAEAQPDE
jgi:hypothetical protein